MAENEAGLHLVKSGKPTLEQESPAAVLRNEARRRLVETYAELKDDMAEIIIIVGMKNGDLLWRNSCDFERANFLVEKVRLGWLASKDYDPPEPDDVA
jgi:hypothetical protein